MVSSWDLLKPAVCVGGQAEDIQTALEVVFRDTSEPSQPVAKEAMPVLTAVHVSVTDDAMLVVVDDEMAINPVVPSSSRPTSAERRSCGSVTASFPRGSGSSTARRGRDPRTTTVSRAPIRAT